MSQLLEFTYNYKEGASSFGDERFFPSFLNRFRYQPDDCVIKGRPTRIDGISERKEVGVGAERRGKTQGRGRERDRETEKKEREREREGGRGNITWNFQTLDQ